MRVCVYSDLKQNACNDNFNSNELSFAALLN